MAEQLKIVIDAEVNKAIAGVHKLEGELNKLTTGSIAQLKKAAISLRTQLDNLSPTALKSNFGKQLSDALKVVNTELKTLEKQSAAATNVAKGGFDKVFSGAKQLANIIPGLGISGLLLIASDALLELASSFFKVKDAALSNLDILKETDKSYAKAVSNVSELRINIDLAKQGFLKKTDVVKQYNETIGKTTGQVKNLDEAEQSLNKNAEAYIRFTLLKAAANIALDKSAQKAFETEIQRREEAKKFLTVGDKLVGLSERSSGAAPGGFVPSGNALQKEKQLLENQAAQRKQDAIKRSEKAQKDLEDIARDFQKQAALIGKQFNFDFFPEFDGKKILPKDQTNEILARARAFVKEFGNVFVLPNLDETFFRGVKQILPDAKKLLENVAKGKLQIKIPVTPEIEFLSDGITPLSKEQLDDLTKRFFSESGVPVDIVIDPTLSLNNTKLIDEKLKLKQQFEDTFGNLGVKAFANIDFTNLTEGIAKATQQFANMKLVLDTLTASVSEGLSSAFNNVFDAILEGKNVFKALGESVKALVVDTIKAIAKMFILRAVTAALGGGGAVGGLGGLIGGFGRGGQANFGLGGAIGGRSFQNTLNVVVTGSISGSTINLAGQRAANSNQRGG